MKKNTHIILGIIQSFLSIYWLYHIISLYVAYQNPNIAFFFMFPNWVIFSNITLSAINLYFGIKLINGKISNKRSYLTMLLLIVIGGLINIFSVA